MFQVDRFDPTQGTGTQQRQSSSKKNKKKRKKDHELPTSTLRVIAQDVESGNRSTEEDRKKLKVPDEALDDFDQDPLSLLETPSIDDEDASSNKQGDRSSSSKEVPRDVAAAIHMSTLPIDQAAKVWELAPFLVKKLHQDGYNNFFPIQSLVIPDIIASERHSQILRSRDVCVAAPTGSGKTLAFVIPVLNALSSRVVRRLRALVVLPSRDLAAQVYKVFEQFAEGSDLKIGLAIGQSDFVKEQRSILVGEYDPLEDEATTRLRHELDPTNLELALRAYHTPTSSSSVEEINGAIDVLVATPGRLIDHLDKTKGFSLQHLRFLVIDEADRLVSQSYHSFIGRIMESVTSTSQKAWSDIVTHKDENTTGTRADAVPITWRRPEKATESLSLEARVCQKVQLRKLLFSATLTKDPQKLASLGLVNPKFYDAHHLFHSSTGKMSGNSNGPQRYAMPQGLDESILECTAEQKPLFLMSLLRQHSRKDHIVVIFTSSLDSTHRLARLLQLLWYKSGMGDAAQVAEYSSALSQTQRTELVQRCNNDTSNEIQVVVCSDGMSRGMDLARVHLVINYDVPSYAKTYVHRCGRTARAGRSGMAISLLKAGQATMFQKIRQLIEGPDRVTTIDIAKDLVRETVAAYKVCVGMLRQVMEDEANGVLNQLNPLTTNYLTDGD